MEELMLLRKMVEEHDYPGAIALIDEMEEMAKDDKVNKVESYIEIILIHLIKQQAEKKTTRSWDLSIYNSLYKVHRVNKQRKAGGYYQNEDDLRETISEAFRVALNIAASEAFGGAYSTEQLAAIIDPAEAERECLEKIMAFRP